LTFTGIHGVIPHKIELFIATPVRTSYPSREIIAFEVNKIN
jgi:hypothetical protein